MEGKETVSEVNQSGEPSLDLSPKQEEEDKCIENAAHTDPSNLNDSASKKEQEEKKKEGPKLLDLAFGMDCTGSMGSYINSAQNGIRSIVEEIVSKEAADIRLALVEYRDHPPQDSTFVTRVHDFTTSVRTMKTWLDACKATGGGDGPEAVADALHQLLKLSWREEATKIVVFISDAPPHGLDTSGDGFPNGCPDGLDPMRTAHEMAEKGITLYQVGCEPAILRYKEFFTGLAHCTGGQYVPLSHATHLTQVIVGGAQEELSLQQLMEQVNREVEAEMAAAAPGELSHKQIAGRIHSKMASHGVKSKKMVMNQRAMPKASREARNFSHCADMSTANAMYASSKPAMSMPAERTDFSSARTKSKKSASKRKGSGFLGGMMNWMTGSAKEPEDDGAPGMPQAMPVSSPAPPPPPAAMGEDLYGVEEDADIGKAQVYRMVQKSLMQQKNSYRVREDSCSSGEED